MGAAPDDVALPSRAGIADWVKQNLFSTWYNALFTLIVIALLALALRTVVDWVVFTARWDAITVNLKLISVGQYPSDEMWRGARVSCWSR